MLGRLAAALLVLAACRGADGPPSAPMSSASGNALTPVVPEVPPPPPASASGLAGSTWHFCDVPKETVTFEPNGSVTFRTGGAANVHGVQCGNARWMVQNGDQLKFDCNNFTAYELTLGDDEMHGEWHRVQNPSEHSPTCLSRDR